MKQGSLFENTELKPWDREKEIIFNKPRLLEKIEELKAARSLLVIRREVGSLKQLLHNPKTDRVGLLNIDRNGDTVVFKKGPLFEDLTQIEEAHTQERAKYYIERLRKGTEERRTNKINDINLNRWKEYEEIITDSLWVLSKRDTSGAHLGWYWGNFIPQIPHQMMLRYTRKGDWVLDPFVGSGTTLIECRRLGRNGIGVEINPEVAEKARELIRKEGNRDEVVTDVITGDSRTIDFTKILADKGITKVQLLIMHPPYHDIIKFSKDPNDLSNAPSVKVFLKMFGEVVDNTYALLESGRYFALVIGDKYSKGEWIPLGFYTMQEVLKRGYSLKSVIVKNFEETRAKRNQKELWRYRALVGGFYIFKHEYVLLFKKSKKKGAQSVGGN